MDIHSRLLSITLLFIFTYMINLPFGHLRGKARKYSLRWFLYIHIPIPLIIAVRLLAHIDYRYIPLFVLAAIIGQFHGGKLGINATGNSC
jgi:hypothetical protein